jgi:hypothetical protein
MSERVQCFLLEETGNVQIGLRRYRSGEPYDCPVPGNYYHNAVVPIGEEPVNRDAEGCHWGCAPMVDHADPHWPAVCECGYVFQPDEEWQVCRTLLYRRGDTGEILTMDKAPAGAMWWCEWLAGRTDGPLHLQRGGGPHLLVKTPGGDWDIDQKSSNGEGWTREGSPPHVTAHPSILIHNRDGSERYHGWLREGALEQC